MTVLPRNLIRVAFASFVTNSATWLYRLTTSYFIWEATKSGAMLSLLAVAEFLPNLVVTPYAGIISDRIRLKRSSYVICGLLGLLSLVAVLAVTVLPQDRFVFVIVVITAAMSTVSALSRTVHQKILGYVFTPQSIGRALSLNTISLNIGRVAAPTVLMGLISQDLLWVSYFLNALSYAVVAYTTYAFDYARQQGQAAAGRMNIHKAIGNGLRCLLEHRILRQLLALAMVEAVCLSAFFELLPMLSATYLGIAADLFTRISISIAVFSFIAGLLKLFSPVRLQAGLFPAALLVAAGLVAGGLNSGSLVWACLAFGLASFLIVLVRIGIVELVHVEAPEHVKGQALGYYFLSISGGGAAGAAVYGVLHDAGYGGFLPLVPIIVFVGILALRAAR
ncbi:MFS transporter [Roseibium sp.]|uniref:MFS transporter n=1 Tax=Roseibium sp. TaxID=1936156 RepID=UPI003A9801E6